MDKVDAQLSIEAAYSRKHINKYIDSAIRADINSELKVQEGVILMNRWLQGDYYDTKAARLAQLDPLSVDQLVRDVFTTIAYYQTPELFVSVTGQLARKLGFSDHRDSIMTIAEIVGVLCQTDAFDVYKANENASLTIINRLDLPVDLVDLINRSMYLPPMVCSPEPVTSNYESGYLTHNDSIMLGQDNCHDGNLCLDIINLQNSIPLKLDQEFLDTVYERPTHELDTLEKMEQWSTFVIESHKIYDVILEEGDGEFWLTHKTDKRGRLYAQGYHITTQGSPYKKAMIELAATEVVTGVPDGT